MLLWYILFCTHTPQHFFIVCLLINYLFLFLVQDDAEAQGSSGSQEKENSEDQMETSTEVCLQLMNLKFPRTTTMQQEGGIQV